MIRRCTEKILPYEAPTRKVRNLMNTVALVMAGGEGTRLYPLTAEHAKPALPFSHGYRIVDFVLDTE